MPLHVWRLRDPPGGAYRGDWKDGSELLRLVQAQEALCIPVLNSWHDSGMGVGQLTFDGIEVPASSGRPRDGSGASAKLKRRRRPSASRAVLAFHRALGLPIRRYVCRLIPPEERDLRIRLLREETEEFAVAARQGDVVAVADALADVVYVAYGTALHYGIDLDAAVAEIHRSNMSKLGPDGRAFLRSDGKVLKGPDYRPPDLPSVLGTPVDDEDVDRLGRIAANPDGTATASKLAAEGKSQWTAAEMEHAEVRAAITVRVEDREVRRRRSG